MYDHNNPRQYRDFIVYPLHIFAQFLNRPYTLEKQGAMFGADFLSWNSFKRDNCVYEAIHTVLIYIVVVLQWRCPDAELTRAARLNFFLFRNDTIMSVTISKTLPSKNRPSKNPTVQTRTLPAVGTLYHRYLSSEKGKCSYSWINKDQVSFLRLAQQYVHLGKYQLHGTRMGSVNAIVSECYQSIFLFVTQDFSPTLTILLVRIPFSTL